jgi:small subunit ribosomal protein S6
MNRYEILLLTVPHMTEDESGAIERGIEKIAKGIPGSTLLSYDKWGKCKLAYEIGKHEYGLYFLIRFELTDPKRLFEEIRGLLTMKYNDSVIRFLTKKLEENEPLVYQRQEPVEDSSTRDVGDFLRKNKMEGLLSSVPGENGDSRPERPRYSSFSRKPRRDDASSTERTSHDSEGISS